MSLIAWLPIDSAPKSGTLIALLLPPTEDRLNPLDDTSGYTQTIGFNNLELDHIDEWKFAGWDWSGDEFAIGSGTPVMWHAILDVPMYIEPDAQAS